MRVETPVDWRWGTADAAFLARVVQQLDTPQRQITIHGLPQDLDNLLALARAETVRWAQAQPCHRVLPRGLVCSLWIGRATCTHS